MFGLCFESNDFKHGFWLAYISVENRSVRSTKYVHVLCHGLFMVNIETVISSINLAEQVSVKHSNAPSIDSSNL